MLGDRLVLKKIMHQAFHVGRRNIRVIKQYLRFDVWAYGHKLKVLTAHDESNSAIFVRFGMRTCRASTKNIVKLFSCRTNVVPLKNISQQLKCAGNDI